MQLLGKTIASISTAAVLMFSSFTMAEVGPWELKEYEEDKNIQVFTRTVEGSPLDEFRGVTQIKTSVNSLVALFKDADAAPDWMYEVTEFKAIERMSENNNIYYLVNNAPWPVTDRDIYIQLELSADANGVVNTKITGHSDYKADREDHIRMLNLKSHWTFTPKADGMVEVVYQVHADPGGDLPSFLANTVMIETPLNSLDKMHDIIQDEKYQGKTFAFIEEAKAQQVAATE